MSSFITFDALDANRAIRKMIAGKGRELIVIGGMLVIFVVSWAYMLHVATERTGTGLLSVAAQPHGQGWQTQEILASFLMWFVMMTAMMLPSVAPWVLALSRMTRKKEGQSALSFMEGAFLAGYLLVWAGYSILAACGQWWLHKNAFLSPAMESASPFFGGLLLILAGLFQWSPARDRCLDHCRSPLGFFLTSWKSGRRGAFHMGFQHGLYCVSCCWALMALSFVAGVMNLIWMGLITILLLLDLVIMKNYWFDKAIGIALLLWGLWVFLG